MRVKLLARESDIFNKHKGNDASQAEIVTLAGCRRQTCTAAAGATAGTAALNFKIDTREQLSW